METKSFDRVTLLNISLFVEAFLLLIATIWSQIAGIQLVLSLHPHSRHIVLGLESGAALAAISLILFWLGKFIQPLARLREIVTEQIAPMFCDLKFFDVLLLASVSGFCEEVLFRGVVQGQFGLVGTSIIFGLFHCPSLRHLSYGIWAFSAGVFLGWLYQITGSLWVPIFAHGISNAISLLYIRFVIKPLPKSSDDKKRSE